MIIINKPEINSIVLHDKNHEWLYYSDPVRILSADTVETVVDVLREALHEAENNGCFIAGYLSYEAASAFDNALVTRDSCGFPLVWLGVYRKPCVVTVPGITDEPLTDIVLKPLTSPYIYNKDIARIKEYIAAGDTYQVNYTFRMQTDTPFEPWNYFLNKVNNHPVPYASFINTERYSVLSFSPELFFELQNDKITCKPMKGTAARGRYNEEDSTVALELQNSVKNRAENVMIVDMIRNDLGKIADINSIQVTNLFEIERYATVHQMVSTITAKTTASIDEIFRALFPCASITGAPKIRTCEIIHELETLPRKVYCGALGYIHPGRAARFSVPIRTMIVDNTHDSTEYSVGGGIVADSRCNDEFNECFTKAQVITKKQVDFSLIETLRYEKNSGFFLKEYHCDRLLDSAHYFAFPISRAQVESYLDSIESVLEDRTRVRLLYHPVNGLKHSCFGFNDTAMPLKVTYAIPPVHSENIFLYHKTTVRDFFDSAIAACNGYDDVILVNEKNEVTEMTIGNIVAEINGELLTPDFRCGLLQGVFRRALIEQGKIREAVITKEELCAASKVYRINSVRKWETCELKKCRTV